MKDALVAVQSHVLGAITLTVPFPPLAGKTWLEGEIESTHCAALMLSKIPLAPLLPKLSVAWTVKDLPLPVGVPLIVPEEDRESPAGSEPAVTAQV